ncbi:MAG TPA: hypothetical protein VHY08_12970 [Bacillota bacterium]|nr:hypothetical protein [Bacillota bacterium]
MKRMKPGVLRKSLWTMMVVVGLFIAIGVEASAAIPDQLYLEVVIEPNHQPVVPCQINNQESNNLSSNPANGGLSSHAAHHPSANGPVIQPVPLTEAARLEAIKELNDSQNFLNNLTQFFE